MDLRATHIPDIFWDTRWEYTDVTDTRLVRRFFRFAMSLRSAPGLAVRTVVQGYGDDEK
ncbi:hypothetical protein GCM10007392_46620 [Saccharospirillum salsuginis]|uniref:Uncharacterized protein n=1 Tax=Saccharospirillum salsuginis TaxID=418750 RepID=A0A918KS20_9GAMM|nr:hypothetical protein GCM10007392_46620 [Saccharospirillum salsuginis]